MAGTWEGGGSALGGLAGGLFSGYQQGAAMLRQKQQDAEKKQYNERAYETTKESNRLRQQDWESRYGQGGNQGTKPVTTQGAGTPQQPNMRYAPPPPPGAQMPMQPPDPEKAGGADMGGMFRSGADAFKQGFRGGGGGFGGGKGFDSGGADDYGDGNGDDPQGLWNMNPDAFSTAVSGQEPPEDIRMDEQGGATGGYGGAQAMRPGAGAMPQNVQHAQRVGRMGAYEHMQTDKAALMQKVQQLTYRLQQHDQQNPMRPGQRDPVREEIVANLQPAAQALHQLGGTQQQPEGAIEEQKGRILRDTAVGYPGAQGEYPPMQGAAIDFLGNEKGTERHIGGASLLRQRFPNEVVPRQSTARPPTPSFKQYRNYGNPY